MTRALRVIATLLTLSACGQAPEQERAQARPRFEKLAADGRVLALSEGPWACVRDTQTGLSWETKALNEGPHYQQATHSWFEAASGSGVSDGGDCAEEPLHGGPVYYACDTQDLVDVVRAERLCAHDDWRLPTAAELASLVNRQAPSGEPLAHNALFPHLQKAPYWTADRRRARHGLEAAVFHFGDGGTAWLPPSRAARLILVRGPRGDTKSGGAAGTARSAPQR